MNEADSQGTQGGRKGDPVESVKGALAKLDVAGIADSLGRAAKDIARQLGLGKREDSPYIVYDRSSAGSATGKTILGAVLVLIALGFAGWGLVNLALVFFAPALSIIPLLTAAGFGAWGGLQLRSARREKELDEALLRMEGELGERESVSLSELAQITGMPVGRLEPLLAEAIERGYIPEGHLAGQTGRRTLFLTDSSWEEELQARSRGERRDHEQGREGQQTATGESPVADVSELPADAAEVVAACASFAQAAVRARSQIADEEVRASLDGIVAKVAGVAAYVRKYPEVAPQLRKLVTYYLPTTEKLAASYAELEGRKGEQAASTRDELGETLALVDSALAKFSDELMQEQSWDLKSDMDVMRAMLEQDGLSD